MLPVARRNQHNGCMRRAHDWFRQAELDVDAGATVLDGDHPEWACFIAQQAAEKAVKALHEAEGTEAWGHSVAELIAGLPAVPDRVSNAAKALDKHYIPARYPNAHPAGAPGDSYTRAEAERALDEAREVLDFVRSRLPQA
jgi:HEPN domain-containing protein